MASGSALLGLALALASLPASCSAPRRAHERVVRQALEVRADGVWRVDLADGPAGPFDELSHAADVAVVRVRVVAGEPRTLTARLVPVRVTAAGEVWLGETRVALDATEVLIEEEGELGPYRDPMGPVRRFGGTAGRVVLGFVAFVGVVLTLGLLGASVTVGDNPYGP